MSTVYIWFLYYLFTFPQRAELTDFDRFKLKRARSVRNKIRTEEYKKLLKRLYNPIRKSQQHKRAKKRALQKKTTSGKKITSGKKTKSGATSGKKKWKHGNISLYCSNNYCKINECWYSYNVFILFKSKGLKNDRKFLYI